MIQKTKKIKNFKKLNCGPKTDLSYSCYSRKHLTTLKYRWNKTYLNKKIYDNKSYNIWRTLKKHMKSICADERCWLKQPFISNNLDRSLKQHTFAPDSPKTWEKNPNTWLNSNDIINIMKQYEHQYPNFEFLGPSPIDFDKKLGKTCVWSSLCRINIKNLLKNGKNQIGIVLNTDPHYSSGEHWICIYINLDKQYIYYFDSNADEMPIQVKTFCDRVIAQAKELNIILTQYINNTKHQMSNTECGMYVLYIIIYLLKTNRLPHFIKRIPDKKMTNLRKKLFN
jgi:hypothetical protein